MTTEFWRPEFNIESRSDGTILMRQKGELPAYLPTLADYLDQWASKRPGQVWLARRQDGNNWNSISFGEARTSAATLGASLLALGLGPAKPLLVLSENSLEHGLLGLACAYVGIPYAPISPAYSLTSKDHVKLQNIVALLKPGALFADDGAVFSTAIDAVDVPIVINSKNSLGSAVHFDSLMNGDPATAMAARKGLTEDTVVKYLFTSGSTGSPKAVINTNGMICSMQAMVRDCYRFLTRQPPVVLDWAPWNHTAAGNKVSYLTLTNGGSYYIDDGRPVPGKFDETLHNLREIACTWYFNVPAGWDMLVDALERDTALASNFFSRLDMMFYAGAGMAQHTWDRLRDIARKTTGREVLLGAGYGSTETAPFALACTEVQDKSGNIGVPAKGLSMKLVPADGKLELRLKGPSIMPGYFADPDSTAAVFDEEGYYKMGDAVRPANPDDFTRGFLFNGRLAENFKLNTGTWVAVGAVRAAFVDAMGGLIRDAVITGENDAEVGALILLSDQALAMSESTRIRALRERLISAAAKATGSASCVRRAIVLQNAPSFDRGEITEKGSLNQRAMRAGHEEMIKHLHSGGAGVIYC